MNAFKNLFSSGNADTLPTVFIRRQSMRDEADALRHEASELSGKIGALNIAVVEANNAIRGKIGNERTYNPERPSARERVAREAATEARATYDAARERMDFIAIRRGELADELDIPAAFTQKDVKNHAKVLMAVREQVQKFEAALQKQSDTIESLGAVADPRAELSAQRASLLVDIATGDRAPQELEQFDAASAPTLAAIERQDQVLTETKAVAEILSGKLADAKQAAVELSTLTREIRARVLFDALEEAKAAHVIASAAETQARTRFEGLRHLLKMNGYSAPELDDRAPVDQHLASKAETQRMIQGGLGFLV